MPGQGRKITHHSEYLFIYIYIYIYIYRNLSPVKILPKYWLIWNQSAIKLCHLQSTDDLKWNDGVLGLFCAHCFRLNWATTDDLCDTSEIYFFRYPLKLYMHTHVLPGLKLYMRTHVLPGLKLYTCTHMSFLVWSYTCAHMSFLVWRYTCAHMSFLVWSYTCTHMSFLVWSYTCAHMSFMVWCYSCAHMSFLVWSYTCAHMSFLICSYTCTHMSFLVCSYTCTHMSFLVCSYTCAHMSFLIWSYTCAHMSFLVFVICTGRLRCQTSKYITTYKSISGPHIIFLLIWETYMSRVIHPQCISQAILNSTSTGSKLPNLFTTYMCNI